MSFWGLFHKKGNEHKERNRPFKLVFPFLSDHVTVPQRTVSFNYRHMHVHPRAYECIINEKTKDKFPGEQHVRKHNIQEKLRGIGSAPHLPTPTSVPTGARTVCLHSRQNQDVGLRPFLRETSLVVLSFLTLVIQSTR